MKKKLIAGVFLATMVASLAGCGTSKETKTTSTESTTVKEAESTTQVVKDTNYYINTASDEELLSKKPEPIQSVLVSKRSDNSEYYICNTRIKSFASTDRLDVGRDYVYDVFVFPTSIDGHDIKVLDEHAEDGDVVVNEKDTYEYGGINAQVVVIPNSFEYVSIDVLARGVRERDNDVVNLDDGRRVGANFNIKRIVLPSTIKKLYGVTQYPNLTKINLPASLEHIDEDVFKMSPTLTATVDKGSYAETFCKEHNIKFIYREE